jgi:hypothetical protein
MELQGLLEVFDGEHSGATNFFVMTGSLKLEYSGTLKTPMGTMAP